MIAVLISTVIVAAGFTIALRRHRRRVRRPQPTTELGKALAATPQVVATMLGQAPRRPVTSVSRRYGTAR
jgi:hypothetical protein